ncbi:MAG: peroxiredoxin family protein [Chitinophagales bacterium]
MKRSTIIIILIFLAQLTIAQTINIEFTYFAGQTYEFKIFKGEQYITLQEDTIPQNGKVVLKIPKEYAGYQGMAMWYLTNSRTGGGLDLIINNENFSVTCLDSIPTEENIIYKNTNENIFDKTNYKKQQALFQKHDAMFATKNAYSKDTELYKLASKEYESIKAQYIAYNNDLKHSKLYASKFRQIVNLTMGIGTIISTNELEKAININNFMVNELDYQILYTSNHWGGIINSWVQIQTMVLKNDKQFVTNTKNILNRIKNDEVYTAFVSKFTKELTKVGKDNVLAAIVPTVKNSKRLQNYNGVLSIYQQDLTGKGPDLINTEHIGEVADHNHRSTVIKTNKLNSKYTLLVFYQSGCGPCEQTMLGLQGNYKNIKEKGVEIISISADTEEQVFKNTSFVYPWQHKLCDFKGIRGMNFKNYAVLGTPTLYLLDSKGIILEKMATIEEVLTWLKEK